MSIFKTSKLSSWGLFASWTLPQMLYGVARQNTLRKGHEGSMALYTLPFTGLIRIKFRGAWGLEQDMLRSRTMT